MKLKKYLCILMTLILLLPLIACGDAHIYNAAKISDIKNGSGDKVIGQTSVLKVKSEDITEESLNDWYFNHVLPNDFDWATILYSDKDNYTGVYATKGMVIKNVYFTPEIDGSYMYSGDSHDAVYYTEKDGILVQK